MLGINAAAAVFHSGRILCLRHHLEVRCWFGNLPNHICKVHQGRPLAIVWATGRAPHPLVESLIRSSRMLRVLILFDSANPAQPSEAKLWSESDCTEAWNFFLLLLSC